jgi:hypothetical protein
METSIVSAVCIGRNCLLGNGKKIAKYLFEDFYLPLYLPLWADDKLGVGYCVDSSERTQCRRV